MGDRADGDESVASVVFHVAIASEKPSFLDTSICGNGLPSFAARNQGFWHDSFRTSATVRIQRRHRRNAKLLADGPPGQSLFIPESHNFVPAKYTPGPSDNLSRRLRRPNAGKRALTDHLSFKFGHRSENLEQQAAGGVLFVRIERLACGDEADAVAGERRQLLIQVEHGAAKPINLVHHDAVEFPIGGIGHQAVKGRTACLCAAEPGVNVLTGIRPFTPGNVIPKLPQLHLAILIGGADTGVQGATHMIIVHYFRTHVNTSEFPICKYGG
jgi:hypothetical protein